MYKYSTWRTLRLLNPSLASQSHSQSYYHNSATTMMNSIINRSVIPCPALLHMLFSRHDDRKFFAIWEAEENPEPRRIVYLRLGIMIFPSSTLSGWCRYLSLWWRRLSCSWETTLELRITWSYIEARSTTKRWRLQKSSSTLISLVLFRTWAFGH